MLLNRSKRLLSCCPGGRGAIYEVSVSFKDGGKVRDEYYNWLSSHHVAEVLDFDGFVSAELLKEYQGNGIVVRYTVESPEVYERYNRSEVAKKLRQDALDLFGPIFTASRRVLISSDVVYK